MNTLPELLAEVPQRGRVRWLGVRPQSREAVLEPEAVEARREAGLTGDHARPGPRNARQVTLIQWEHLAVVSALLGREITPADLRRFPRVVANSRVGSTVDVVVWRGGKEVPLKLRVGEQEEADKQNASAQGTQKKPAEPDQQITSTIEQLGLTLQKVTDQLRERYGLSDQIKGVVITKVAANSPAAEKQLQAGDVILEVDQKPVTTPQEVTDLVTKLQQQKKRSVLLFVERQGDPRFAALRLTK